MSQQKARVRVLTPAAALAVEHELCRAIGLTLGLARFFRDADSGALELDPSEVGAEVSGSLADLMASLFALGTTLGIDAMQVGRKLGYCVEGEGEVERAE